uniref:Uncharacterized protein n=1 Tax=Anguilla anguilla TaxID=7936 RepID=A0A0E9TKM9_ANGAN
MENWQKRGVSNFRELPIGCKSDLARTVFCLRR